ncbi:MAG: diacylglycerol kinase family protein [Chitinophagaceae bacterium]|nr:diacylglycerol kinase family protein [Chitinophagaceae bacterium]
MRKILYIINPAAGTGKASSTILRQLIIQKTKAEAIPFEMMTSREDGDYSALHSVIQDEHFTDVVVAGGDGTVNQVVAHLRNHNVRFGILPVGSGNGLAYAAGISANRAKAMDVILKAKARPVDGISILNFYDKKTETRFACMLCGFGFDAEIAHAFSKSSKRGFLTYAKMVVSKYRSAPAYPFEISVNQAVISAKAFFLSIANSNQYGNHFTIAPFARLDDGLLDVILCKQMPKLKGIYHVFRQVLKFNRPVSLSEQAAFKNNILYIQSDSLFIRNLAGAAFHIDGDPAETPLSTEIKIIPKCFLLIQP